MIAESLLALLLAPVGCTTEPTDDGAGEETETEGGSGAPCVPGQSMPCTCTDGSAGAQVCDADGSEYGACECDGSATSGSATQTGSDPTNATSGPGEEGSASGGDALPTFDDIKLILIQSCGANVDACHSRVAYGAAIDANCRGWTAFEDAPLGSVFYAGPQEGEPTGCPDMELHDRLLQLNSWQCGPGNPGPGLPLVAPGDPASSYIMMKINGDVCMVAGEPSLAMPPPGEPFVLPAASRAALEAWIAAGAPEN